MDTELTTVYYRSCSGITGWWLTPDEAAQLFADNACEGTLEGGFAYYGASWEHVNLIGTVVRPRPITAAPDDARAALEERARTQLAATAK